MKLATIHYQGVDQVGVVKGDEFFSLRSMDPSFPGSMLELIEKYHSVKVAIANKLECATATCKLSEAEILPPLPNPPTFRDFLTFEEHLQNGSTRYSKDIGEEPPPIPSAWYRIPVHYYSNPNNMRGSGTPLPIQADSNCFDFEFEMAVIIGKRGINIPEAEAEDYIFGYTILNDWSARDVQTEELGCRLGPCKGKDYATSIGPVIITKDELEQYRCADDPKRFDLKTRLTRNGILMRENNIKKMQHPFTAMIAHASRNVPLNIGDLMGSGTVA